MNEEDRTRLDQVESKVSGVDKKVDCIQESVDEIKDNHLPHIYEKLGALDLLKKFIIGISVGMCLLIIGIVINICLGG